MPHAPPTQRQLVIDPGGTGDDRGAPVRSAALRAGACPSVASPIVRGALARHRALLAKSWVVRYLQSVAALATIAVAILIAVEVGAPIVEGTRSRWAWTVIPLLFVAAVSPAAVIALLMLRVERRFKRAAFRELMLSLGRCPSCGFTIGCNVEKVLDGCTVCSECGAAWRADRVAPIATDEADAWQAAIFRTAALRTAARQPILLTDARGHRVAPRVSIRLPKDGPWGTLARIGFVVLCVVVVVLVVSLLVPIGAIATGSLANVVYTDASVGMPEDVRVGLTIVTIMLLFPLVLLIPAVLIAASIAHMRRVLSVHGHVCPACDSRMDLGDRVAPAVSCAACNAVWRR
jgi:hypothetical protein